MKVLFVWPNKDAPFYKPISIALFSAMLKKAGHQTRCFDTSFVDFGYTTISDSTTEIKIHKPVDLSPYNLKKEKTDANKLLLEELDSFKPDVVAFTVISDEVEIAQNLSTVVKRWNKDAVVIWGGKGTTVEPERILSFEAVDYVCIGEGIIAFPEFINALEKKQPLDKIKNIWCKNESGIVRNQLNPLFEDLDNLPYLDWDVFDQRLFFKPYEGKVYRSGDHMISWGCPNDCSYCLNNYYHEMYNGFKLQRYSPRRIIDELKYLTEKHHIEFYKFHDEDFLLKPASYLEELAELYAKEVGIPFTCMANSKLVTEKGAQLLKKMNCASVSLGIETGDLQLRKDILKRKDTEEEIIKAFAVLKAAGIRTLAFNMIGLPFETRETFFKTVELNRKVNPQVPQIGIFFPFKKTALREIAIKNGFYDPQREKVYDPSRPALEFKNISSQEILALKKKFVLYVKLPKEFWPYIERSEKDDEFGKKTEAKLFEIFNDTVFANDGWYNDHGKINEYLAELKILEKGQ